MLIGDSFEIEYPPEEVWTFFQDIPRVAACRPGVRSVEETQPDHFRGVLEVVVGPISTRFDGQGTILTPDPDRRHIVAEVEGEDGVSTTSVRATFSGQLSKVDGGTHVDFESDLTMRGRLATFGSAVVRGTPRKMTMASSRCVQEALVP